MNCTLPLMFKFFTFPLLSIFILLLNPATVLGSNYPHKGICYASWQKNDYSSSSSDRSLKKATKLGTEYIAIVITQYQDSASSKNIKKTSKTPSDKSLIHAINKAHDLNFKVMLKPHLDLLEPYNDSLCRSDIGFYTEKDWEEWFNAYQSFILHYARIAEDLNVELFCIGTELSFTTEKNDLWVNKIINEIKNIYSGKLVYAANWDNYKNIQFWNELDYVGIDAYFPLYPKRNPSLTQIKRGWEKWKAELRAWHKKINKPILFTEIGYTSSEYSAYEPWKDSIERTANNEMQTKCYKAFFETIWGCSWLAGVYWWHWGLDSADQNNSHFSPQNKPTEKIIKHYYKN